MNQQQQRLFRSEEEPTIRRRIPKSQRRRDGLLRFAKNRTSQSGEDGVIQRIFSLLPPPPSSSPTLQTDSSSSPTPTYWCVDVGAWDGKHLSNTYSLLVPEDTDTTKKQQQKWHGILIEADTARYHDLCALHEPLQNVCLNRAVSGMSDSQQHQPNNLVNILLSDPAVRERVDFSAPGQILDFLCIDIDGSDYWVMESILRTSQQQHQKSRRRIRPRVICIEFNPTMPNDLIYIPARNDTVRHGASLAALVELAQTHQYTLVETTLYNAFFVDHSLYEQYLKNEVPDTSIEALHEPTMGTSLYQLYDGTLKLWGCKRMLWHRVPVSW